MSALIAVLSAAWRLTRPYFASERRVRALGLLAAVIGLDLIRVAAVVQLNFWNRAFYNALQDKDWPAFTNLLLTWQTGKDGFIPGFCGLAAGLIVLSTYRTYLSQWIQIDWRDWLTERLLGHFLADRAYYTLSLTQNAGPGTDNPDQRIADDVRLFTTSTLGLGLGLLSNIVTLFSFITILWSISGTITLLGFAVPGYMVWIALLYAVAGSVLTHLVGRPLAALNFQEQQVEADFRFALARMRDNVEAIALHDGEHAEHQDLRRRFQAVIANWWAIMWRTKKLNFLTVFYAQAAVVFPFIIAAPRYFSGAIPLGALMQTASAFGRVEDAFSWFVNAYQSLASWRATVDRLDGFTRSIDTARGQAGTGVARRAGAGADYVLDDVSIALPDGPALLAAPELTLKAGQSTVITGASGQGKSTLFRAIAGIWPFGGGRVTAPAGRTMFLPQRPYLPLGPLRRALAYPATPDAYSDAAMQDALHQAGLGHLAGQLDQDSPWSQRLSGGEQQRVAVARALLARPDWLFLDEATASLDAEAEAALYATLRRALPGTTIVSIAHRQAVADLHDRRVAVVHGQVGTPR